MSAINSSVVEVTRVSLPRRILLAAASGMSVWPTHYILMFLSPALGELQSAGSYVLIGGVFGALILVPLVNTKHSRHGRIAVLMIGSALVYALAVELAAGSYGPLDLGYTSSVVVSGLLGALLVGLLTKFAAPLHVSTMNWVYLMIAGIFGGFLFSLAFESDHDYVSAMGYVAWQVSVCLALNLGRASDI